MTNIAMIKAEIERLYNDKSYSEDRWDMGYDCACEDILSFLSTLESEEPNKSLYEAATKFADTQNKNFLNPEIVKNIFIAGAEWQANHAPLPEDTVIFNKGVAEGKRLMLEDAVEGFVAAHLTSEGTKITVNSGYLPKEMCIKPGEKVRIIVCKKED